jgi:hypothetical protein
LDAVSDRPELVISVCDRAHELHPPGWADPAVGGRPEAFDAMVVELRRRIGALVEAAP